MTYWETLWSALVGAGSRQTSGTQLVGPGGYGYSAPVCVTEETALQLSAVWACVRLISQTVASLPLVVYRKTDKGREVDNDHWFAKLMAGKPNQYQTKYEFWEHQIGNLALHGNMYARKTELGGVIRSLLPLNPLQVETKLIAGKVAHLFTMDGNVAALSSESVWHARMNGDLIVGRSPLQFGRNIFATAQGAEQATSKLYVNGGKKSGVLSFDKLLTPEQRNQIRANFDSLTTGTDDRLLVLEMGATFEAISMSPQDIELLASRRYSNEEICRWFGVPSVLVNDTAGSTTWGSGIEQIVLGFYKLNLRPYLEAIENSITTHLFTDADRAGWEVEFDFEGLLRATQKDRYAGYQTAIGSGLMTPNEARELEWLPAVDGGDQLLIQGAMIPVKDAGKVPASPTNTPPQGEGETDGV